MHQGTDEQTLSGSLERLTGDAKLVPGLTVAWHPDPAMIGAQTPISFDAAGKFQISRHSPDFVGAESGVQGPLAERTVSRSAIGLERLAGGHLRLIAPSSSMKVYVDNQLVTGFIDFDLGALEAGLLLTIGPNVMVRLHQIAAYRKSSADGLLRGVSYAIRNAQSMIGMAANSKLPVLILGPSGTGKELVAQTVHTQSDRAAHKLISVNMATLSESLAAAELFGAARGAYTGATGVRKGLFREADGSSLFMDEIGDTPDSVQPMLLRALESGEFRPLGANESVQVDVRLIAATDRNLQDGFNIPLLRRLEGFVIKMPQLSVRKEDIGVLIVHFLDNLDFQHDQLPNHFVQELMLYDWPGNVRQLKNVVERAVVTVQAGGTVALEEMVVECERQDTATRRRNSYVHPNTVSDDALINALEHCNWEIAAAAKELNVSRTSMYALINACDAITDASDVQPAELAKVVAADPHHPANWAKHFKTPRAALEKRAKALGLI